MGGDGCGDRKTMVVVLTSQKTVRWWKSGAVEDEDLMVMMILYLTQPPNFETLQNSFIAIAWL